MLRLRTFGGLALDSDAGPLAGAALQRRRLALLATLATAGSRGLSRDKLLALLWSEADDARARQALSQALYALRRDAQAKALVLGAEQLRLNPEAITSDVADFEAALERGNREHAASLYAGPFLDGVYLSDGAEFERWSEEQRLRLAHLAEGALEQLAAEADARRDYRAAAAWWRRLAALDPLKTRAAVGLMTALAAAGDRAGALKHARVYQRLVRQELDASPNPDISALAARLRADPGHDMQDTEERDAARPHTGLTAQEQLPPDSPKLLAGRYAVERELGRGGMAVVFLARDLRHDRPVALKMLHPEFGAAIGRERFQREIALTARLQHPHILALHDSGDADGSLFYVMPYVEGESLRARLLREHQLPVHDAVRIAREVADALDHAHRRGVVHRDIKPENILLADGHAVVADFGIARTMSAALKETLTELGLALGTPAYMSPEQGAGERELDARSDIYSLGCVLYEMLAGRPPFVGPNPQAVLARRFTEEPPRLREQRSSVPPALEDAVRRALAAVPADRYQTSADFARTLASLESVSVQSPRAPDAGEPWGGGRTGGSRLPKPTGSLIGRDRERAAAASLLRQPEVHLLSLTGAGGSGKTRLALQLAVDVHAHFSDGIFFVDLAPIRNADLVIPAIAHSLGLYEGADRPPLESVTAHLADGRFLLVLDNFEQVIAAGGAVARMLASCAGLKVLVTSRVRLHLRGEHEFVVPPLAVPDPEQLPPPEDLRRVPAVDLFVRRTIESRPDFSPDADALRTIAEICVRLDGLPLAIELAAARSKLLSPQAILSRLERRFDFLTGGARDLPARHQTLRAAIAWSYDLLDERRREAFRRLAVFGGGCSLDAMSAVCLQGAAGDADALELVQSLVDESLVRQGEDDDGEPRLLMLETIREYALERLRESGEEAATRDQHRDFYVALAERLGPELTGQAQGRRLSQLDRERDNLRLALDWAERTSESSAVARFVLALWRYWLVRGHLSEGRERLRRAIERCEDASADTRADLLTAAGTLTQNQGDYGTAFSYFERSLALWRRLNERAGIARVLASMGWLAWRQCRYSEARALSEESLELHRGLGDEGGVAQALNNLGWIANFEGDYAVSSTFLSECLAVRRRLGDRRGTAFALTTLAWSVARLGDHSRAGPMLTEALTLFREVGERQLLAFAVAVAAELACDTGVTQEAATLLEAETIPTFREIGDRWGLAYAVGVLGDVRHVERRHADSMQAYEESLALSRALGDRYGLAAGFGRLAVAAAAQGEYEQTAAFSAVADRLLVEVGGALAPAQRERYAAAVAAARVALGEAVFAAAQAGAIMREVVAEDAGRVASVQV